MGLFCGYFTAVAMLPVNRPSGTLFFGAYCARHSASLHAGLSTIAPPALVRFCRAGAGVPRVTSWYARAIAESERPGSRGGKSLGASADGALGPSYMNGARNHGVGTWRQKQRRGRGRGRGGDGADQEIGAPREGKGADRDAAANCAANGRRYTTKPKGARQRRPVRGRIKKTGKS